MDEDYTVYNAYYCSACDVYWEDYWDCSCNDKCPSCNQEIEPSYSEVLED